MGAGRLMFSSFALRELTGWPEGAALLSAIYDYMASDAFAPEQALTQETIAKIFT